MGAPPVNESDLMNAGVDNSNVNLSNQDEESEEEILRRVMEESRKFHEEEEKKRKQEEEKTEGKNGNKENYGTEEDYLLECMQQVNINENNKDKIKVQNQQENG